MRTRHVASSAVQDWDEYAGLHGHVWKKRAGGHGPLGEFAAKIKDRQHPITEGLEGCKTEGERCAKPCGDAGSELLVAADSEWSKKVEYWVCVAPHGAGRVVHNRLEHGPDSKRNRSSPKLLCRGFEWAATGKVTVA